MWSGGEPRFPPRRANLVYQGATGAWALAKLARGDCAVEALPLSEVVASNRGARGTGYKWLLRTERCDHDSLGRPTKCIIRNDRHPQRSLRAGAVVKADDRRWTTEHTWILEYAGVGEVSAGAVGSAFHLRSLAAGLAERYLVVDESTGGLMLQAAQPTCRWELHDAHDRRGQAARLERQVAASGVAVVAELSPAARREMREPVLRGDSACAEACEAWGSAVAVAAEFASCCDDSCREVFDGSLAEACRRADVVCDGCGDARGFTDIETFVSHGFALGEEVVIRDSPASASSILEDLLVAGSLRRRLADGDAPVVSPLVQTDRAPWCSNATTTQTLAVPVLGRRPFSEAWRVVACTGGPDAAPPQLAVRLSSCLHIGWPMGDFVTEALHVFECDAGPQGRVVLRSWGLVRSGGARKQAAEGLQEARSKFVAFVREELQAGALRRPPSQGPASPVARGPPLPTLPGLERPLGDEDDEVAEEVASPLVVQPPQAGPEAPGRRHSPWRRLRCCATRRSRAPHLPAWLRDCRG